MSTDQKTQKEPTTSVAETAPLNDMGLFPVTDSEVSQCITYICNLSYSDVLDPCKNAKFPGGLAVSLSRELLPRLHGFDSHHKAYDPAHILSWVNPAERVIPPMMVSSTTNASGKPGKRDGGLNSGDNGSAGCQFDILAVDFGDAHNLFEIRPLLCICPSSLDFGGPDGLFRTD